MWEYSPEAWVDPACPMEASHPLNLGKLGWWLTVPNLGWHGGLTFRDLVQGSRYPHHAALVSGVTWNDSSGYKNGRSYLDFGSAGYADCGSDGALAPGPELSFAFWLRFENGTGGFPFSRSTGGSNGIDFLVNPTSAADTGVFRVNGAGTNITLPAQTWAHIACVRSTTDGVRRTFVNGTLAVLLGSAGTMTNAGPLQFGTRNSAVHPGTSVVQVADVHYWPKRALTYGDVAALYQESCRGYPQMLRWMPSRVYSFPPPGAPGAYTLAASAGAFALSGQTVALKTARTLAASAGPFALTRQPAILKTIRTIAASVGTFALAGQNVALLYAPISADQFATDGCWTWFNSPVAWYDPTSTSTFVGAMSAAGDVKLHRYNHLTGRLQSFTQHVGLGADDHNDPAVIVLNSAGARPNKLELMYSQHAGNAYHREGYVAGGAAAFTPVPSPFSMSRSYAQCFQMGDTARTLYWIYRDEITFAPAGPRRLMTSTDGGVTWSTPVSMYNTPADRPYIQVYRTSGSRFDVITGDGNSRINVYHFYCVVASDGSRSWFKSDGTQIGTGDSALPLTAATVTQVYDGTLTLSWVWDLCEIGGVMTAAFATFSPVDGSGLATHNYQIARYIGGTWVVEQVCDGGGTGGDYLYASESHYSGGICLDPNDANAVYVSRKYGAADFRVEKWVKSGTWSKAVDISGNTGSINARPRRCENSPTTRIFYWRGSYTSYTVYSTNIHVYPALAINTYAIPARAKPTTPAWQAARAPAGCNGYWPFTEGSGTTITDLVPSSPHNGSFVGAPSWGSGAYGPELSSFSTTKYVAVNPASQLMGTGSFPFWYAVLIRNTSTTDGLPCSQGHSSNSNPVVSLRVNNAGAAGATMWFTRGDSVDVSINVPGTISNDGNPHVLMGVCWSDTHSTLWFDGRKIGTDNLGSIGTLTNNRLAFGVLLRSAAALAFGGTVIAVACGSGDAPDPADFADDWLSGDFLALRLAPGGTLPVAAGTFTLAGQPAVLKTNRKLVAAVGTNALAGQAVALIRTSVGAYTLAAGRGMFALSGQPASLLASKKMTIAPRGFALSGQDVLFRVLRSLGILPGSFLKIGKDVPLRYGPIVIVYAPTLGARAEFVATLDARAEFVATLDDPAEFFP